jgi:hypothetical protein
MCDAIALGIASFVVGSVGSIASYSQQQAQTAAANQASFQNYLFTNQQISSQANQALQQNIFNLQSQNQQVQFQNQNALQQSIFQSDSVNRSNLRANQEWQDALVQNQYSNLNKDLDYTSRLAQSMLSQRTADLQQQINQRGLNADLEDAQRKLRDAQALSAFESEKLMASNLQATGTLLSSGKSGQSIGLAAQSLDAAYGRDLSMVGTNFQNRMEDFYSDTMRSYMRKTQADAEAISRIIPEPLKPIDIPAPSAPIYASMPEAPIFAPFQTKLAPMADVIWAPAPIQQKGPSALGLVAGIGGSIVGGIQTGYQMDGMINPAPAPKARTGFG